MRDTLEAGTPAPDRFHIGGRHVLATLIVFFGVVFAVNGYMLVRALATHSGVVAVEPYRRGLAYNERIDADLRQAGLRWQDAVDFSGPGFVTVVMTSRDGSPISGLALSARLGRPSTAIADRDLDFREDAAGRYVAPTGTLDAGGWLLALEVRRAGDTSEPVYRAKRRLWLKP